MNHLQIAVIRQDKSWVHQRNSEVKQHRHQHQQDEEHRLDKLACLLLLPQLFSHNTHTHRFSKAHISPADTSQIQL